jgi:hypothetical protein
MTSELVMVVMVVVVVVVVGACDLVEASELVGASEPG